MVVVRAEEHAGGMNTIRSAFARNGLVRSNDSQVLGGVCSGIGRRLGLTPWVSRLLFVVLLMVLPGSQLLLYPVLWILMPDEDSVVVRRPATPYPTA
jgi:phage shock protein C